MPKIYQVIILFNFILFAPGYLVYAEGDVEQSFSPWNPDSLVTVNEAITKEPNRQEDSGAATQGSNMIIIFYQKTISPQDGAVCRFKPTCSRYAREAVQKKGILIGTIRAADRLIRDNPFNKGEYDPVD